MKLLLAIRYAFSSSSHHRSRSIRTIITVSLSLMALIVIMSIMDFLQDSRFRDIRATRSFTYTIEGKVKDEIISLNPRLTPFEYGEGEALTEDGAYFVRYIDSDYDGGISKLGQNKDIYVPYNLYSAVKEGNLDLYMLKKGKSGASIPQRVCYHNIGLYYSKLGDEFDSTMLFLPIEASDSSVHFVTAIQNINKAEIKELEENGLKGTLWKEKEKSLYSVLKLEETMMYLVLAILFVVIMVSLKMAVRIFCKAKNQELKTLEILGLKRSAVTHSVLLSFLIIILIGILLGFVLGNVALHIVEKISVMSPSIITMNLTLPYMGFISFSLLMLLLTFIFITLEERKRDQEDLKEVYYE